MKYLNFSNKKRVVVIVLLILMSLLIILPRPKIKNDFSTVILDRNREIIRVFLNNKEQWKLENSDNIPKKLELSVLNFEDKYFYYHLGINPISMIKAFFNNLKNKKIISGASTITMQLSRVLNPKKRNYFNKLKEIVYSLRLELWLSKKEILKNYLENISYGSNIIGYRSASLIYYKKEPINLTWAEASTLAVLPNSPGLISPIINSKYLLNKRNYLLKKLLHKKIIDNSTYQVSIIEPIPNKLNYFPFLAPHLSQKIKLEKTSNKNKIETTLLKKYQKDIEIIVKNNLNLLKKQGINNVSALVIKNNSKEIYTYIGSGDFFDKKNFGEVNGVLSPRSTGSILKPFLYALSIDEGLILPQTLLKDIPTNYNGFSPENADKSFRGLVRAKEALTTSLNIPAVRLLNSYGVYNFYSFLKEAGISTLFRSYDDYGLSIVLGGAEANLLEIASLYSSLASYKGFSKAKYFKNENRLKKELISKGSTKLTLNMISDLSRPNNEKYWKTYSNKEKIYWKTGTSYGQRDAWAIGSNEEWTVAVWTGNFNGSGNPNISGNKSSGTIMFDIFNYLTEKKSKKKLINFSKYLNKVRICSETGFLFKKSCSKAEYVDAPINMKPLKLCPYHQEIYITKDNRFRVSSKCWDQQNYKKQKVLIYPTETQQYLDINNLLNIPELKNECVEPLSKPKITYPNKNSNIVIPMDFGSNKQKLVLKAKHNYKNKTIYWYLNHQFIGKTIKENNIGIDLIKGRYHLEIVDEDGIRDNTFFNIK